MSWKYDKENPGQRLGANKVDLNGQESLEFKNNLQKYKDVFKTEKKSKGSNSANASQLPISQPQTQSQKSRIQPVRNSEINHESSIHVYYDDNEREESPIFQSPKNLKSLNHGLNTIL